MLVMQTDPGLQWVEPAMALHLSALRLAIPHDEGALFARFAASPAPQSLLTLVELAPTLGLEPQAVRADLTALAQMPLPSVLHVGNPLDESDQGFIVLVGRDDRGLIVEGEAAATFVLTPQELSGLWTGVVVSFQKSEAGVVEGQDPRRRWRDWRRRVAGALGGARRRLSIAVLALIIVFGAATGWEGTDPLACAGLISLWAGLAAAATYASRSVVLRTRAGKNAGVRACVAQSACGGGRFGSCDGVLASRWAAPFGLDLGAIAVSHSVATLIVLATLVLLPPPLKASALLALAVAHAVAAPVSIFLIGVQLLALRRFCALCAWGHLAVLGGLAIGLGMAPPLSLDALRGSWPFLVWFALAALAAREILIPLFTSDLDLRGARERLAFIGATSWGPLAELIGRPAVTSSPSPTPFLLGDKSRGLRVDALVDPACPACFSIVDQLSALVQAHGDRVHVVVHLPTQPGADPAVRELRVALTAEGSAAAFTRVRDDGVRWLAVAARGAEAVLADLADGPAAASLLDDARTAQTAASLLAEQTGRSTPTILVEGRRWTRPLWELDVLLSCHPERLTAAVSTREAPLALAAAT